jgi:hypothetical protein
MPEHGGLSVDSDECPASRALMADGLHAERLLRERDNAGVGRDVGTDRVAEETQLR